MLNLINTELLIKSAVSNVVATEFGGNANLYDIMVEDVLNHGTDNIDTVINNHITEPLYKIVQQVEQYIKEFYTE